MAGDELGWDDLPDELPLSSASEYLSLSDEEAGGVPDPMVDEVGERAPPEGIAGHPPLAAPHRHVGNAGPEVSIRLEPGAAASLPPKRPHGGRPPKRGPTLQPSSSIVPVGGEVNDGAGAAQVSEEPHAREEDNAAIVRAWHGRGMAPSDHRAAALIQHGARGIHEFRSELGFSVVPCDIAATIGALVDSCCSDVDLREDEVCTFLENMLGGDGMPVGSVEAMSMAMGLDRDKVMPFAHRAASSLTTLSRARWSQAQQQMLAAVPRDYLVHVVECVQYDETPMRTRLLGFSGRRRQTAPGDRPLMRSSRLQKPLKSCAP